MARFFLMSPPAPGWRIVGGANYKSKSHRSVNPRKALQEWLALADAVTAAGAEVAVLSPPTAPELLTGLMYTANAGWLVTPARFKVAKLSVAHRQGEAAHLLKTLPGLLQLQADLSAAVWEGQADMCALSPTAVLLSYGVRSVIESLAEVRSSLPPGVRSHAARLREPFFHGDTCMDVIDAPAGKLWLVYPGAFASPTDYREARAFAEREAEVLEISEADALGYACNALSIGEVLLAPEGLSLELSSRVAARGLTLRVLDFDELFGKGGGGPRCLVNELRGLPSLPPSARYSEQRGALAAAVDRYPTSSVDQTSAHLE